MRVHHSVADAPDVNVSVNGDAALTEVPYTASSGVLELDEGSYSVQVDGILPDGSFATVIGPADLELDGETRYEVFAVGKVSDGSIAPLIIANPVSDIAAGNFRLQVVHAAPDAPMVDIYLTAPAVDVTLDNADAPAIANLAFREATDFIGLPAADYLVDVAAAGGTPVVIDDAELTLATSDR